MNYAKLHKAVENNKLSITELCKKIDITRQTFYNNLENKTLKVETLEKIADLLDLPVSYFFDQSEPNALSVSEPKVKYDTKQEKSSTEGDLIQALKELNQCRKEKELLMAKNIKMIK